MNKKRLRKLKAVFTELKARGLVPADDDKRHFRHLRRMFSSGELKEYLPKL